VAKIHDRMPAILVESDEQAWLDDWLSVTEAKRMLRLYAAELMVAYPVSSAVNVLANDTAAVLRKAA
jgi:putative SOS response-associated peptidase YedK